MGHIERFNKAVQKAKDQIALEYKEGKIEIVDERINKIVIRKKSDSGYYHYSFRIYLSNKRGGWKVDKCDTRNIPIEIYEIKIGFEFLFEEFEKMAEQWSKENESRMIDNEILSLKGDIDGWQERVNDRMKKLDYAQKILNNFKVKLKKMEENKADTNTTCRKSEG